MTDDRVLKTDPQSRQATTNGQQRFVLGTVHANEKKSIYHEGHGAGRTVDIPD